MQDILRPTTPVTPPSRAADQLEGGTYQLLEYNSQQHQRLYEIVWLNTNGLTPGEVLDELNARKTAVRLFQRGEAHKAFVNGQLDLVPQDSPLQRFRITA